MPSSHDHFSISKEFNDIIPTLNEWTNEEGSTNNRGLKSRNICLAIRFYLQHLKGVELTRQNGGVSSLNDAFKTQGLIHMRQQTPAYQTCQLF
jgi:hypothetical protein